MFIAAVVLCQACWIYPNERGGGRGQGGPFIEDDSRDLPAGVREYVCRSFSACVVESDCDHGHVCNQATGYCQRTDCGAQHTLCSESNDCQLGADCLDACLCGDEVVEVEARCVDDEAAAETCDDVCNPKRAEIDRP